MQGLAACLLDADRCRRAPVTTSPPATRWTTRNQRETCLLLRPVSSPVSTRDRRTQTNGHHVSPDSPRHETIACKPAHPPSRHQDPHTMIATQLAALEIAVCVVEATPHSAVANSFRIPSKPPLGRPGQSLHTPIAILFFSCLFTHPSPPPPTGKSLKASGSADAST